jgi:DNA (cytosine-5)-methyltransferase 1
MRYLSVCSGIESASVAWSALAWSPVAFAEIEPFASSVLAHHYPGVINLGDINEFTQWPRTDIDVLVGGTPCQSFSIAGFRDGLADPRGNLALVYLGIADLHRPRWLVWENVPGALSTNAGNDFRSIIGGMVELGYGIAWRVLNAHHVRTRGFPRAVPQRRSRLFVVGYLGNWRRAAAVLFDSESLRRNPPPRREAGQGVVPTLDASADNRGWGTDFLASGGMIPVGVPEIITQAINAKWHKRSSGPAGDEVVNLIAVADPICANEQRTYTHEGENNFRLRNVVPDGLKVRRLTPRECERAQGFPDDYTLIPYRGGMAKDNPRYRALGNAMAVNCIQWIGERIRMVEET